MPIETEILNGDNWKPRDSSERENAERITKMLEIANWFYGQAEDFSDRQGLL